LRRRGVGGDLPDQSGQRDARQQRQQPGLGDVARKDAVRLEEESGEARPDRPAAPAERTQRSPFSAVAQAASPVFSFSA
jgi:hypothetical protein